MMLIHQNCFEVMTARIAQRNLKPVRSSTLQHMKKDMQCLATHSFMGFVFIDWDYFRSATGAEVQACQEWSESKALASFSDSVCFYGAPLTFCFKGPWSGGKAKGKEGQSLRHIFDVFDCLRIDLSTNMIDNYHMINGLRCIYIYI